MESITQKSKEVFGLDVLLNRLASVVSSDEFDLFCKVAPDGQELMNLFNQWRSQNDNGKEQVIHELFIKFGRSLIDKHTPEET